MSRVAASSVARPAWGNLVLWTIIACLVLGLGALHLREWEWHEPGVTRWSAAGVVLSIWLGFTAAVVLRRRARSHAVGAMTGAGDEAMLVAFASQTGTAAQLAKQTADSLRLTGMAVRLLDLADLDEHALAKAQRILFVVSTTGEGDAPDSAAGFVTRSMHARQNLAHLRYGVLALGDSDYDNFCGFGRQLQHWLQLSAATPLFDLVEVDNGDPAASRHWQHHLSLLSGATELPDWERPNYQRWQLVERQLLNAGSLGGQSFHLALRSLDGEATWQAGDLVEVGPRHASNDVEAWLQQVPYDGNERISHDGREASVREWLAISHLPAPEAVRDCTPVELVSALTRLPHREYSIASLPTDGSLHLLVRRMLREDGTVGLGSGWLTQHAELGAEIALRIRSNPGFHAPQNGRPLILIGNGTGLAGLRALLKTRIAEGSTRNWLLFGERQAAHDFYYRDEITQWQQQGLLERLDLAWSRDGATHVYVQDRLREVATTLRDWVGDGGAIYVCGSLVGMAPGVDAVLRDVLGDDAVELLREQGRYRRDVY
ncbi:sulfite reductase subunit alpha [Dyella sp. 20L07]|uniref:sulfite reductase subunit alpha n=1 Tax=Dyella sp. 20L07 TaxID=3384240 RepID=UPI003D2E6CD3